MQKIAILTVSLMLLSSPLFAEELGRYEASHWTERETRAERIIGKLGFGAKNALLGWSELIYHPYTAGMNGKNIIEGAAVGLWYGLADTAGGLIHLVTFPFSSFDVKLPEGGTHMFQEPPIP